VTTHLSCESDPGFSQQLMLLLGSFPLLYKKLHMTKCIAFLFL